MSVDMKWQDIPDGEHSIIAIWGYDSDGHNRKSLKEKQINGSQDWDRIVLTGTVPTGVTQVRACISHRRNGGIYATNFKLEKGNKATDWTPAPEDVTRDIATAKTEAVNSASSDATTKANNALNNAKSYADTKKTEAINSANATTVEKLKSYSTTEQMNSAITVAKDQINSSVSNTYTTKTEFKNMVVGGQNSLKNSNFHNKGNDWINQSGATLAYGTSSVIDETFITISKTGVTANTWSGIKQIFATTIPSKTALTFGFEYYVSTAEWDTWDSDVAMELKGYKDGATSDTPLGRITITKGNATKDKWKREFITITTDAKYNAVYAYIWVKKNGKVNVTRTFVQEGNKATQWSLSPKDAQNSITNLQTRMNTAEQKITDQAIINTVSSTFVNKTEFNNLAIGGGNMILNSNFQYQLAGWKGANDYFSVTADNLLHYNTTNLTESKNYQKYCDPIDITQITGKQVTVSVDYKVVDKSVFGNSAVAYVRFFNNDTSTSQADSLAYANLYVSSNYTNDTWATTTTTITVPTNAKYMRVGAYVNKNGTVYWRRFKAEQGNKATPWSPALEDAKLYTDNISSDISINLSDLSNIVAINTGSDAITPATKVQLVAEFEDVKAIYNKINSIYNALGDSSMSSLKTDMTTAYNALSSAITGLNNAIDQPSETGLSDIVSKFSTFYQESEELQGALTNALTNVTKTHTTEIKQLSDKVTISATKAENLEGSVNNLTTRFQFDTDGLTIKSSANSQKYIKLDNDSLDFMDSGNMVAQISNNNLNISSATITNQMKIGNIAIKPSGKGGLMFVYE